MKLAVEKLSPIPGGAVGLNNLNVVTRISFFTIAVMGTILIVRGSIDFPEPWIPYSCLALLWTTSLVANFRIFEYIMAGLALRRLRYNGLITCYRDEFEGIEDAERPWSSYIPKRFLKREPFLSHIGPKLEAALEKLSLEDDTASFFLGVDETGRYALKYYHACNFNSCTTDLDKHFRPHDEKRDGAIHWGGL